MAYFSSAAAAGRLVSGQPRIWIDVSRGRTKFPRRPILQDRTLIGAGSNCQLQLGGEGMPFLHSLLLVRPDGIRIEAFVPHPELLHNGQPVQSAQLADGDSLTIGSFCFTIRIGQAEPSSGATTARVQRGPSAEKIMRRQAAAMSAAELVDAIEAAEHEVLEYESGRVHGAAALLDAICRVPEESDGTESDLYADLDRLADGLEGHVARLRTREQRAELRRKSLVEQQNRLLEQIRAMGQLNAPAEESSPRRASA